MRLIDADALSAKMYHEAFETDTDFQRWDSGCWIRYKMFENALKDAPTIEPEQRWIPCTERLPEDGRCLVTRFDSVTNTCFLDILWYEKGVWWNRQYAGDFTVTAWMPLPEAYNYKGETNGETK